MLLWVEGIVALVKRLHPPLCKFDGGRCTGLSNGHLSEKLIEAAKVNVKLEKNPQKLRPSDELIGDNWKIKEECGWKLEIPINKTLKECWSGGERNFGPKDLASSGSTRWS